MLTELPLEIQIRIISDDHSGSLKFVNKHFYSLYNNLFYDKLINTFGESIVPVIERLTPWLKLYIKSLDVFRRQSREIIARVNDLEDIDEVTLPFNCCYISDSWKYIYSILKNKRLFAEYKDYKVDEPTNYVFNHYVEVNRTYLLSYKKLFWLAPGKYNLNIALVAQNVSGLGTTKFEIEYKNTDGKSVLQTYFPPTNINEILPNDQFCFLKVGEFTIPPISTQSSNKSIHVQCTMEEIGLYRKSGFSIFFIDISEPTTLLNDYELLYYTVKEVDYRIFINVPLKNLYKALSYIQENKECKESGLGDPADIADDYDFKFINDTEIAGNQVSKSDTSVTINSSNIIEYLNGLRNSDLITNYSEFFFNNKNKNRYFKFNTVYQRRQFINRYGDFDSDWKEFQNSETKDEPANRLCTYDKLGLKWKIPVICDL